MLLKTLATLALCLPLAIAPAAASKHKSKNTGKVIGVKCAQGPDSIVIGISEFKPNQRKVFRKGMRRTINIAGYGPLNCVVI